MAKKPKTPQKENLHTINGRDTFQTPDYATKLLIPFIPKKSIIWECAAGHGKIVNYLDYRGLKIFGTDLAIIPYINFLSDDVTYRFNCIITNPPFSLKRKFYERCKEYDVPFALLIPADYSGWIIKATQDGAEKIIPTRRIDYITPTGLSGANGHTSYYHSMWLTWGFNLGRTETFVELSLKDKENI